MVVTAVRTDTFAPERAQAAYFVHELNRQVAVLDEDMAKLRRRLVHYQLHRQTLQVQQIQRELREAVMQRRKILDMVTALISRFTT